MAKQYDSPPSMIIDESKSYVAKMDTSKGMIEIELFADRAPITVNNFVFLAKDGFDPEYGARPVRRTGAPGCGRAPGPYFRRNRV